MSDSTPRPTPVLDYVHSANVGPGVWGRLLLRPIGRIYFTVLGLITLLTVYATSALGGHFFAFFLAFISWLALGATWIARLVGCVLTGRIYLQSWTTFFRHWRRWIIPPLLALLVGGAIKNDLPLRIMFFINRHALERAATVARVNAKSGPVWIGLYGLCTTTVVDQTVYIRVDGSGFIDTDGFAWCPSGSPTPGSRGTCTPFAGTWYLWHERF